MFVVLNELSLLLRERKFSFQFHFCLHVAVQRKCSLHLLRLPFSVYCVQRVRAVKSNGKFKTSMVLLIVEIFNIISRTVQYYFV